MLRYVTLRYVTLRYVALRYVVIGTKPARIQGVLDVALSYMI